MTYRTMIVVGLICALAVAPGASAQEQVDAGDREKVRAVEAKLDRGLPEINFSGQGLADVLDFLRDVAGMNIMVDWKALERVGIRQDARVEVRLKGVKLRAALNKILEGVATEKGKAGFTLKDGVVVISTAAGDAKAAPAKPGVTGIPKEVDRSLPEVNFNGQGLADSLDFLRDVTGMNIVVNWAALERAGVTKEAPVRVKVRDVKLSVALARILEGVAGKTPLQATFDDGILTITAAAPAAAAKPGADKEKPRQ